MRTIRHVSELFIQFADWRHWKETKSSLKVAMISAIPSIKHRKMQRKAWRKTQIFTSINLEKYNSKNKGQINILQILKYSLFHWNCNLKKKNLAKFMYFLKSNFSKKRTLSSFQNLENLKNSWNRNLLEFLSNKHHDCRQNYWFCKTFKIFLFKWNWNFFLWNQ